MPPPNGPSGHAWSFDAIGTPWQVDTDRPVSESARAAVLDRVDRFDQVWSRFRADSLVAKIAATTGVWTFPDEAAELFDLYETLSRITDGAVTPLIGRTLADLGYDAGYSLRRSDDPAAVPAESVLGWSAPRLTNHDPVLLDVGAAGKGLLVDLVAAELQTLVQPTSMTVDGSGDLLHRGRTPLRVALEHPKDTTVAVGVAELPSGYALCASASNRRAWGDGIHHVLDARTGLPTNDVLATWAVAPTCMLADGTATAAFFTAPETLARELDVAVARLRADGRLEWSRNFAGEMFT